MSPKRSQGERCPVSPEILKPKVPYLSLDRKKCGRKILDGVTHRIYERINFE